MGMAGSALSRTMRPPRLGAALGASDISTERTSAWSPPTLVAACEREPAGAALVGAACEMGRTGGLRADFFLALRATRRVYKGLTGRRCLDRVVDAKKVDGGRGRLPAGQPWDTLEDVDYDISCPDMQGTPTCRLCQVPTAFIPLWGEGQGGGT